MGEPGPWTPVVVSQEEEGESSDNNCCSSSEEEEDTSSTSSSSSSGQTLTGCFPSTASASSDKNSIQDLDLSKDLLPDTFIIDQFHKAISDNKSASTTKKRRRLD